MAGPLKKGCPKRAGSGRVKGTPNKVTRAVREVLAAVFTELQDLDAKGKAKYANANMLSWAQREPTEFYRLAVRLLPAEVKAEVSGAPPLIIKLVSFADLPDSDNDE